jgi:hypothetical protein
MIGRIAWLLFVLLAGCGQPMAGASNASPATHTPNPAVAPTSGGCGTTPAVFGRGPGWLAALGSDGSPYVMASPPIAAAMVSVPLRAGHPTNPFNKLAWVVSLPRADTPLVIDAHPLDRPTPVVHIEVPDVHVEVPGVDHSRAGWVYTSIIDLPTPGCWHIDLQWGSPKHAASLNLQVSPAGS